MVALSNCKCAAILLLLSILITGIQASSYKWSYRIMMSNVTNPSAEDILLNTESILNHVDTLLPNSDYLLEVKILNSAGTICTECFWDVITSGGYPELRFSNQKITVQYTSVNDWMNAHSKYYFDNFDSQKYSWYLPIHTSDSGVSTITIYITQFCPINLSSRLNELEFNLIISHVERESPKSGQILSLLSDVQASGLPSDVLSNIDIKTIQVFSIIKWSALTLITFKNYPSQYVLITDHFRSFPSVVKIPDSVFALGADKCGSTRGNLVYSGVFYSESVLLNTNIGLVRGKWKNSLNSSFNPLEVEWSLLVNRCFPFIHYPKQGFEIKVANVVRTVAIDSSNIVFVMNLESFIFLPCKDIYYGYDVNSAMGFTSGSVNFKAVTIGFSVSDTDMVYVLFQDTISSRFYLCLMTLLLDEMAAATEFYPGYWQIQTTFPLTIPLVPESQSTSPFQILSEVGILFPPTVELSDVQWIPLNLTGMTFTESLSYDIAFYGNCILICSNGAVIPMVIRSYNDSVVHRVSTALTNSILVEYYSTASIYPNYLFIRLGQYRASPIDASFSPYIVNPSNFNALYRMLFFDFNGNFVYFSLTNANSMLYPVGLTFNNTRVDSFYDNYADFYSEILFHDYMDMVGCPFSHFWVSSSNPISLTRDSSILDNTIPPEIYLDKGDSYQLSIEFRASVWDSKRMIETIDIMPNVVNHETSHVTLTSTRFFNVFPNRTIEDGATDYYSTIVINVNEKQDLEGTNKPGENLALTVWRLNFWNATLSCRTSQNAINDPVTVGKDLTIYVGCKPMFTLVVDFDDSLFNWCGPPYDIPCALFERDFTPKISIVDELTRDKQQWNETYTLNIIAYGSDPQNLIYLSDNEIKTYNPGFSSKSTIWAPNFDFDANAGASPSFQQPQSVVAPVLGDPTFFSIHSYGPNSTAITWYCYPGSPCDWLTPANGKAASEIYFKMRVQSDNPDTSYCLYQTDFTVRVMSVPLGHAQSLLITGYSTLVVVAFITLLTVIFHYKNLLY